MQTSILQTSPTKDSRDLPNKDKQQHKVTINRLSTKSVRIHLSLYLERMSFNIKMHYKEQFSYEHDEQ